MNFTHTYDDKCKKVKYKGTYFSCISAKEFEQNDTLTSLGFIKPLEDATRPTSTKTLKVEGSNTRFKIVNKKPFLHKISHYAKVTDGSDKNDLYVTLSKLNFFPLFIALIILILSAFLIVKYSNNPDNSIITDIYEGLVDEKPVTNNKPDKMLKPGEVRVPGYTNLYIEKGDAIYLNNPKDNTCTFKYIVKLSGKDDIIYESKDIPNGKADMWYPDLEAGKYSVDFYIQITKKDGTKGITPYIPNINLEIYK